MDVSHSFSKDLHSDSPVMGLADTSWWRTIIYGDEGLGKLHVSKTYRKSLDGIGVLSPLTVLSTATIDKESIANLEAQALPFLTGKDIALQWTEK